MQRNDLCRILGVPITAMKAECKIAFHKLAHVHHPDKGGNVEKFKEINSAYQEILKLPEYSEPIPMTAGFGFGGMTTGGFTVHVYYDAGFSNQQAQAQSDIQNANAQQQKHGNRSTFIGTIHF